MRFLLTIGIIVCTQLSLSAQDLRQRIEAMQREYVGMTAVHIVMNIKVSENKSEKPFLNEKGVIKRNQSNYFYSFSGVEMLMNDKYILMVDGPSRQIVCAKRSVKKEDKFTDQFQANLDSILSFYEAPVLLDKNGDVEHYKVIQKKGLVREVELYIDGKLNVLKRLDYLYENGQYSVIEFEVFDRNPVFNNTDFSEGKYVQVEKGKLKTTPLYSRFNLSVN